jgi:hypothetical protein
MKTLIHIGTHKTATTFLQYNYFPAIKGINYFHGPLVFTNLIKSGCSLEENTLLSYEGFSGIAWNLLWVKGIQNDFHWINSFEKSISNLHKLISEADILIVFRRHGDLLLSMYKQYVQEVGILKFHEFFSETGVIRKEDLNYTFRIKKVCSLFNKVYVLSYEDFKKSGNNFFDSFIERELNLSRNDLSIDKSKFNRGISGSKLELLRKINKVYRKFPFRLSNFLNCLGWSPERILRQKLAFWSPKDFVEFQKIRDEINIEMQDDWDVEAVKWQYNPWKDDNSIKSPLAIS